MDNNQVYVTGPLDALYSSALLYVVNIPELLNYVYLM